MNIPNNLFYSKEHEWVRFEGDRAWVGITDYAQETLGDIVFVELPEVGSSVEAMDEAGVVESVKAVSPIFCPVSGTIVEVNDLLEEQPELLNSEPYQQHVFVVEATAMSEKDELMNAADYQRFVEQQH